MELRNAEKVTDEEEVAAAYAAALEVSTCMTARFKKKKSRTGNRFKKAFEYTVSVFESWLHSLFILSIPSLCPGLW